MNFDLADGAGGTYYLSRIDRELVPIESDSGYVVGLSGGAILLALHCSSDLLRQTMERIGYSSSYVGYWRCNELVYVDPVRVVAETVEAVRLGFENSQKEIFDYALNKSLPFVLVDETQLYGNILRRFSYGLHDIFCCWSFDHLGRETFVCGVDIADSESLASFNAKYNPQPKIDRAVIQIVNFSQSQTRR